MSDENTILITRDDLAEALAAWEAAASAENWPGRLDPERHNDAADWLINFMDSGEPITITMSRPAEAGQ